MIRLLDIILSLAVLLLTSPILLVLLIAGKIKLGSPVFTQTRVGMYAAPFTLYKFRSLPILTPDMPTHNLGDTYISGYGRFLRQSKLDELPQLVCVLLGDMSLVGPRPCLPSQKELISERLRRGVLSYRPGITGLAQIEGIDMSTPTKLAKRDAHMLKQLSLRMYICIISKTVFGLFARH